MSSEKHRPDSDVRVKAFAWLGVALLGLVAAAMVAMWFLTSRIFEQQKAQDPPPPLMKEAREPHAPPAPRLQADPFAELAVWRASQQERLTSYGWVEGSAETAHIPIDRAMDLLVEGGLPQPAADSADQAEPTGDE